MEEYDVEADFVIQMSIYSSESYNPCLEIFIRSCMDGNLPMVKFILENSIININHSTVLLKIEQAFYKACQLRSIKVAKYLIKKFIDYEKMYRWIYAFGYNCDRRKLINYIIYIKLKNGKPIEFMYNNFNHYTKKLIEWLKEPVFDLCIIKKYGFKIFKLCLPKSFQNLCLLKVYTDGTLPTVRSV
jgi:hypothetical protein